MVRRRLNRKVAFLGSAFFVIIALTSILVVLQLKRDPQEFIKDAEAAHQSARQATDQEAKDEYYEIAKRKYGSAYSRVKTNEERKQILFAMVDLFLETRDWPYVLDCWDKILLIEPDNIDAQYGRLRYFEILGQSGIPGAWQRVHDYASQFLTKAQQANLLNDNMVNLQIAALEQGPTETKYLGTYLYLARGQGALGQANMGSVTNVEEMLNNAMSDFKQAGTLEPNNINVYSNLARTMIAKGGLAQSKGNTDELEKTKQEALAFLEQGVTNSDDDPAAQIDLLNLKLMLAKENDDQQVVEESFKDFESEFASLQNKFSSNADVLEAVSQFYSLYSQYTRLQVSRQNLDKAIDAAANAIKLDNQKASYAIQLSDLYYRRFSIYKSEPDLHKAVETAENALSLPDAQSMPGPRNSIRIRNKFLLNSFLANCYIEQIVEPVAQISESEKEKLLSDAQQAVHEIETIVGTKEDPLVIRWQGMLELAKGNRQEAVVKLNSAYEQLKAVKPAQPPWPMDLDFARLSYTLAKLFINTDELGKVHEFLVSAHYSGIAGINPEARLDYVKVVLQFNRLQDALQNLDAFDEDYGPNPRSRRLRVQAYLLSNKFDDAKKVLDTMQADDPNTVRLHLALAESQIRQIQMSMAQDEVQSDANSATANVDQQKAGEEIKTYNQLAISLIEKLLQTKPELVAQSSIVNACRNCIVSNQIPKAQEIVNAYLAQFPDNISVNIYKQILSEPEPADISPERYAQIENEVLSGISDPVKRAVNLGIFYRRNGDNARAIEQLNIALGAANSIEPNQANPELDNVKLAATHLFEIALASGNQEIAEKVSRVVRDKNLDGFGGLFFEARLTAAKNDLKGALAKVDECLKKRPIFSQLYVLRSSINSALGNDYSAMEDISKAAYMNPLDGAIARRFAISLYNRNENLGSEATAAQVNEARDALEKAIALNQGDMELLGLYTEYIAPTEPQRAVAIRQNMLTAVPSLDNAMSLGTLAMNVALNTTNTDDKEGFFDIAGSAFEQARKIDPNNRQVLLYYTRYLQARGRDEQAQNLLEQSQDSLLVANNLYQNGDYAGAKKVLEKLYDANNTDTDVLRGLMLVSQNLNDQESVKKYSNELVSIDNNLNNLISQIRALLTVGLTTDAQYKLQSLRERYPDEPSAGLLQAWLEFKQDNSQKALETINNFLQNNTTNAAAWQLRSEINTAMAQYDMAITDLQTSKTLSNDPTLGIKLAKVYIQVGRFDDALGELKDVLSKPNPPMEARLLLESVYIRLNRKTALVNFYDNLLEKYPDNLLWLNNAADYALAIEDYERAEKLYKKACDILLANYSGSEQGKEIDDESYVTAFDGYLQALLDGTGDPDRDNWHPEKSELIVKEAQKYVESSFAPMAYVRMAQALLKLHDEDKAVEYCHLALEKIRTNEKYASQVMINIYPMLGLDAITEFCTQTLQKNPDSLPANYVMYYLMRINNDYDKSTDYIDKCIKLTDKESPIRTDYILKKAEMLLYAYAYTSNNKYINMAINDYESLLSEMPNNIKVLNNLAYMLAESNQRLSDALEYSKRAQKLKPNDPGFLDTYAFVLLKSGNDTEAEKTIDEALRQYTEQGQMEVPGEVYEHKGMIKEKVGKKEEALTAYKRALELGSKYFTQKTKDRINQSIERVSL